MGKISWINRRAMMKNIARLFSGAALTKLSVAHANEKSTHDILAIARNDEVIVVNYGFKQRCDWYASFLSSQGRSPLPEWMLRLYVIKQIFAEADAKGKSIVYIYNSKEEPYTEIALYAARIVLVESDGSARELKSRGIPMPK